MAEVPSAKVAKMFRITLCCAVIGLLTLAAEADAQRVRPKIYTFGEHAGHHRQVRREVYAWAVYRPSIHRVERRYQTKEMDYGPAWVARRVAASSRPGDTHAYDILTMAGRGRIAKAHGFFWSKEDPPPHMWWYWEEKKLPDWFQKKTYRLFYPEGDKAWWCRTADGRWDLVEAGQLKTEDGPGPKIELPQIDFR